MQAEVEQLRVKLEGLKELTPGETDTISELQASVAAIPGCMPGTNRVCSAAGSVPPIFHRCCRSCW